MLCAQPFSYTTYRESDGLPSGYIQRAFEDGHGYLWLCTFGGISRFDGRNFKNYDIKDGLAGNFSDDIYEDKNGIFYIATRRGLSIFDRKKFTNYNAPDSVSNAYFSHLSIDKQNVFHCVINGHNAILKGGKLRYEASTNMEGLPAKNYIVATLANGFKILNTEKGIYSVGNNKAQLISANEDFATYFYFHPAEKNAFYFFNQTGVYHYENGVVINLSSLNFKNDIVTALFVDKQKRVWISCEGKGVWIIDKKKISFIDPAELPGYLVTSFFQDKRDVIWICTFRGLVKVNNKFVTHYTKASGLDNEDIRSSGLLADGSFCMQTTNIKNGSPVSLPGNLSSQLDVAVFKNYVSHLQKDALGRWWVFIRNSDIYRWQNGLLQNVTSQFLPVSSVNSFYNKKDSTLWFGNGNSVCIIKNDKIIKQIGKLADGSPLNHIAYIQQDRFGNIWVTENSRTLLYTDRGLIDITTNLELPKKIFANYCCSDKNGIWLGTKGFGALHLSLVNNKWVKDRTITTDNGLGSNYIHDIEVDDKQNVWIATLSGLYRFTENKNPSGNYNMRNFTKADDIDVPNWNLAYLEKDSLQNIWLGVANGIFKINTAGINEFTTAPSVVIDKVTILNSAVRDSIVNRRLRYNQNDIAFNFNGINLSNSYISYSYMLSGRDKAWVTNQANKEAIYYNLSPDSYVFMVKAVNDAGMESPVVTYNFRILPPFWQTWWFRSLIAVVAISLIYWFIKRRDRLKEKENLVALQMSELKLTALQSQMNPHFIFNSLNSIQNYIMQQKPLDAARYLSKFSKLMRRILDHSFSNLTPLSDIVETLKMYMELEAFRFSNEFNWEVKVDDAETISDVKLPPLLLQPYVENAIIHGLMPKEGEKKLLIHLYKKNNELHCVIDDNGVGRGNKLDATAGHISRGQKLTTDMLATMKQLLHTDAQIMITDKTNSANVSAGTTVDLIIPLNK